MNTRIQFDLSEEKVRELERLMEVTEIVTRKDLFNTALTLLQWAAKEKAIGRTIASVDEPTNRYKELVMPALVAAARVGQIELQTATRQAESNIVASENRSNTEGNLETGIEASSSDTGDEVERHFEVAGAVKSSSG